MTYTSDQFKRDKRAMLSEFNRAIAAAKLRKAGTKAPVEATGACTLQGTASKGMNFLPPKT